MKCKAIHKKMIFFLEKELPETEMDQIQLHLSECQDCALFYNELKLTLGILESEKRPEVNPFFYTQLKAKLENRAAEKDVLSSHSVFVRILQPALFSILLLAGIYSGFKIGTPLQTSANNNVSVEQEMVPYLNEMSAEPIESFLMN